MTWHVGWTGRSLSASGRSWYCPRRCANCGRSVSPAGRQPPIHRTEGLDVQADLRLDTVTFTATLRDRQPDAVAELARHEHGVLEAPPGSGKTVMGCALIAHHQVPTLVLVDRAPLMGRRC